MKKGDIQVLLGRCQGVYRDRCVPLFQSVMFYAKEEFLSYFGRKAPSDVFVVARRPIFLGVFFIWFFFGMFLLWATTAEIESAAVARGTIVVETKRKAVQHLEGGIIKEILVKDGDVVEPGQPLIILDETAAGSMYSQLEQQLVALELKRMRVDAELHFKDTFPVPDSLSRSDLMHSDMQVLMNREFEVLASHLQAYRDKVNILQVRVDQLTEEREGYLAQSKAFQKQIALLEEEKEAKAELLDGGFATRSMMRKLEQEIAEREGDYGEYRAKAARITQRIAETNLEISKFQHEHAAAHNEELDVIDVEIANLREQLAASQDVVDRHVIKSPQSGVVTSLNYHTPGGVVGPGAVLMEIVPRHDQLVIDARVQPNDIDVVRVGLPAKVRLLAFKAKTTPLLDGEVIHISPDQLVDRATNAPYFLTHVQLSRDGFLLDSGIKLYPGMQVEVLIVTGSRTFLDYVLQPLRDTMRRAFREE